MIINELILSTALSVCTVNNYTPAVETACTASVYTYLYMYNIAECTTDTDCETREQETYDTILYSITREYI